MHYLFAQDNWDVLTEDIRQRRLFVLLDYDGTLSPIAPSPASAYISHKTRDLLKGLSEDSHSRLAIISGRPIQDIQDRIGLNKIIYSGNHGLEIHGPHIKFTAPVSLRYKAILGQIREELIRRLSSVKGVLVEDKGLSLSLHYRLVDTKYIPLVKSIFHETAILYLVRGKIKVETGKKVIEVRPPIEWDKGKAVLWLLAREEFMANDKTVLPIYIGDDKTDEDAFRALRNKGLTIFVGQTRASSAAYYLQDAQEVTEFLRRILKIRKGLPVCQR